MSAGEFITALYRSDELDIHKVRVQVETTEFAIGESENSSVEGPSTSDERIKVSQGARSFGLRPRKLRMRFDAGEEPTGYLAGQFHEIICFDPLFWTTAEEEDVCTYLGGTGKIKGKVAESRYPA